MKRTQAKCLDSADFLEVNLLPGRKCLEGYQCVSRNCDYDTGICMGRDAGEDCASNADCNGGLACIFEPIWPFAGTCTNKLYALSSCQNDYECGSNYACWY